MKHDTEESTIQAVREHCENRIVELSEQLCTTHMQRYPEHARERIKKQHRARIKELEYLHARLNDGKLWTDDYIGWRK